MTLTKVALASLFLAITVFAEEAHKRSEFNYQSYKPSATVGFYTGQACLDVEIDHVVSLRDAYYSGGASWSHDQKRSFANDKDTHRPSCASINRSKGASIPSEFLRKSRDRKGLDYEIVNLCEYLSIYHSVKMKYGLSFDVNSKAIFRECDLKV